MMIAETTAFGFTIAELALVVVFAYWLSTSILEHLGLSRSSKRLRVENEDLLRRNSELEPLVDKVEKLEGEVEVLLGRIYELEKRDQAAVLAAIETHERNAGARSEAVAARLGEIRDLLAR